MKDLLLVLALFSAIMWTSCGDGNVLIVTDPAVQAADDSATIVNYLADKGLTDRAVKLESGVYYVILERGTGDSIDESDIVSLNYTGKLLNDTIFDTSIREVADSIRAAVEADTVGVDASTIQLNILITFSDLRTYEPFEFTYSASGWTITGQFIAGFTDGISASLKEMQEGGRSLIILPSGQAYGSVGSGLIPPNTVIAFELYPIRVIKQSPVD